MKIVAKLLVTALALLVVAALIDGVTVESFYIAFIVAILLGVINITLRPILVVLTLPINIITLGLFVFVINGALLLFVSSFVDGFTIAGFGTAIVASLVITAFKFIGDRLIDAVD
jgi:putative membrane protein